MYMKEMYVTSSQLKSGESEARAFAEFGNRCGLQQYRKFSGLLEQNRKNGSKNLRETLRLEMADAFEQRKHQAKRMGRKSRYKIVDPAVSSPGCGDGDDHGSGMDRVWLKGGYEMEKQRDNHIEQNVTEQHTTEQGGIYRKIRDFRWMKQVWG